MRILGLDAALGGFSAALDGEGFCAVVATGQQDALERGIGLIEELLAAAHVRLRDLDRIAVGLGPGSFTGVRIAVSYAKAFALGSGVPLVGISSYDALEPPGVAFPGLTVVAGRRDVICARRRDARGLRTACGPVAAVLEQLLTGTPSTLTVAGNTEGVLAQIAERGWTVRALPQPTTAPALAIAQLARTRAASVSPHALAPDYGELPAARVPKAAR